MGMTRDLAIFPATATLLSCTFKFLILLKVKQSHNTPMEAQEGEDV
jgi:hypothetical protein